MNAVLRRLFHIYPGEGKNAFLFALLGFLWSLAVTSGLKFADALFLLHVGAEHLPITYACIASIMVVLASFMLYAFNTFDIYKIFLGVLLSGFCFYVFASIALYFHWGIEEKWFWYALRIFGALFFTICMTCYWTFIDQYHTLQDAKRLFSPFCAMVFLGVATTGFIMRSGLLDLQELFFMICTLLLLTSCWIIKIVRSVKPVYEEAEAFDQQPQPENSFFLVVKRVLRSKFTLALMTGNFIIYLLLVITEYNYLLSFDQHFDTAVVNTMGEEQNAQLTVFLGKCLMVVSIANFLFGLFIYSRLVRRFGVSAMLFVTPLVLITAFTGWSLIDSLIFPVIGLFVVEGTLYVIDDSNFNLLLNAVPSKLKYKIRLMIESFFEPVGMLVSSFLLSLAWIDSRLLGLVLSAAALCIAWIVKKEYPNAIYTNLVENAVHFERTASSWFNRVSPKERVRLENKLLHFLESGSVEEKRLAFHSLQAAGNLQGVERAAKMVAGMPLNLKEQITAAPAPLEYTFWRNSNALIDKLESSPDSESRIACLEALGKLNDPSLALSLISVSGHFRPRERRMAEQILTQFGPSIAPELVNLLLDSDRKDKERMLAGRALARISPKKLREELPTLISKETKRAYFYYYHAKALPASVENLDLALLSDALLTGYHSVMDFIIQILGAAGELEDCELLSKSNRSAHPKIRSQLIETLERTCETPLFQMLYPLLSERPVAEKLASYKQQGGEILELPELLDALMESSSQLNQMVACTFKFHLKTKDWREAVNRLAQSKEEIIQHFSQELLES